MRVELYSVMRCGFYSRGNIDPVFGDLADTLTGLSNWVGSRANVAATATFEDPESTPDQVLCSAFTAIDGRGVLLKLTWMKAWSWLYIGAPPNWARLSALLSPLCCVWFRLPRGYPYMLAAMWILISALALFSGLVIFPEITFKTQASPAKIVYEP